MLLNVGRKEKKWEKEGRKYNEEEGLTEVWIINFENRKDGFPYFTYVIAIISI